MKNLYNIQRLLIVLSLVFLLSCNDDDDSASIFLPLPETILVNEPQLYPEGIVYNKQQDKFYLGSLYKGKIVTVDKDGNLNDFAEDSSLISVVGMTIDETNNWLIVCNSDPGLGLKTDASTIGRLAQIVIYELSTGNKVRTIDLNPILAPGHFANDVITDTIGNIYVSDSFSPIIYKIDPNGNSSILLTDITFSAPAGSFGMNGIVYHPDNYLIVGKYDEGKLFKIPLDNPENFTEITLNSALNTVDGILLTDDDTIVLVSNNLTGASFNETAYQIKTSDNWTTGSVTGTFTNFEGTFPTTATSIDDTVYVIDSYIDKLFTVDTSVETFKIKKILF